MHATVPIVPRIHFVPRSLAIALAAGVLAHHAHAGDLCFGPTPYGVGSEPSGVETADFNGDGLLDLAIANHDPALDNRVSILLNEGAGTFGPGVFYEVGDRPYWIALDDVDADGDVDVAVTNFFGIDVSILLNNGDGTFAPHVPYYAGVGPTFVKLARIDGDAFPDLAVAIAYEDVVSILINNGDGTFAERVTYSVGSNPYGVEATDLNGDAIPDLAVANHSDTTISVLLNNGDGTFAEQTMYAVNEGPVGLAAGDLDNDGFRDLSVADEGYFGEGTTVSVLRNHGDGTFAPSVPYLCGTGPYDVAIVDFNGDGYADLASADVTTSTLSIFFNDGTGAFGPAAAVPVGTSPWSLTVGDLDGSGNLEVAVACAGEDEVWVLFNEYAGIAIPPSDATVAIGDTAAFDVTPAGPGPFTYQWRRDGTDLVDGATDSGSTISGATTATLTISDVQTDDAGAYDVVVTNDCGPTTSVAAALVVQAPPSCPADIDGSGAVGFNDLLAVLSAWGQIGGAEDVDGSGTVGFGDLLLVLSSWGPC
jgi:hypothetical protein